MPGAKVGLRLTSAERSPKIRLFEKVRSLVEIKQVLLETIGAHRTDDYHFGQTVPANKSVEADLPLKIFISFSIH